MTKADPFPPEFRLAPQEFDPAIPMDKLSEHPANPNVGDVEILAESLDEHGFYGAVIVQRSTGYILAGNHRYRLAAAAGAPTLPGFWLDVDDEAAAKILSVDNASTRAGAVDEQRVIDLLSPLTSLLGTGVSGRQFDDMVARLNGQPTRGELLALTGVTVGEPRHQVMDGQVWTLGPSILAVVDVFTGWPVWVPLLESLGAGCVFLPYPSPMMPHVMPGPLLLVQPDLFMAGHLLDKWQDITGTDPEVTT